MSYTSAHLQRCLGWLPAVSLTADSHLWFAEALSLSAPVCHSFMAVCVSFDLGHVHEAWTATLASCHLERQFRNRLEGRSQMREVHQEKTEEYILRIQVADMPVDLLRWGLWLICYPVPPSRVDIIEGWCSQRWNSLNGLQIGISVVQTYLRRTYTKHICRWP